MEPSLKWTHYQKNKESIKLKNTLDNGFRLQLNKYHSNYYHTHKEKPLQQVKLRRLNNNDVRLLQNAKSKQYKKDSGQNQKYWIENKDYLINKDRIYRKSKQYFKAKKSPFYGITLEVEQIFG